MFDLGMDFSTLAETEALGGRFYQDGRQGDLVELLAQNGVNAARLRLWVDPFSSDGAPYGGGTCDLSCCMELSRRAKAQGMRLMLDLHYSDFWCDPSRQLLPKAWRGLSLMALAERVYAYTADTLAAFARAGLSPNCVQVGNEITNGMLWPSGRLTEGTKDFDALVRLLDAGTRAVRAESDARIVLHLEDSGNNARWRTWFDEILGRGVACDVIGASYYPYWHGSMEGLRANLSDMISRYDRDVMIVETAYAFTTEPYPSQEPVPPVIHDALRCADGSRPPYPLTRDGQRRFVQDLLALAQSLPKGRGKGLYYWEPGWLPTRGSTWASEAARAYMDESYKTGGNEWANQCLFDYGGNANPALAAFRDFAKRIGA